MGKIINSPGIGGIKVGANKVPNGDLEFFSSDSSVNISLNLTTKKIDFKSTGGGGGSGVSSVNTRTGAVTLSSADVGLGNANNTSDANKPISTAVAAALLNIKGQKIIYCVQGGEYASLQAAHDAAAAGDTIYVGPSSTSWGTLTVSKPLSIVGIQGARGTNVIVDAITINLTNSNANLNEVHFENLLISTSGVIAYTAPVNAFVQKIRFFSCYFSTGGGAHDLIYLAANTSGTSHYFYDCVFQTPGSHTGNLLHAMAGYNYFRRCSFDGGIRALKMEGGTFQTENCTMEYNNTGEVIDTIGGTIALGFSLTRNLNAAGSAIKMTSPAVVVLGQHFFDVTSGTGYCVKGTGTLLYDRVSFSNSAGTPANVKFQNTVTTLTYTTTPSVVA